MTSFTIPVEEINGHAAFFRRAMEQLVKDQGASVAARTAVKNIHSNVAFLIDYMAGRLAQQSHVAGDRRGGGSGEG